MAPIIWTDYLKYRASLRGFDLSILEQILLHSTERYFDTETRRKVVVGRHGRQLVIMPYDEGEDGITPITVHTVSRQQIQFRLRAGRLIHE
ncbi:MAG: hypothetical protein DCC51_16650 [Anaerolineae bacterium]|nr:MAG: hypothetical protein DCC51_16650 [Anaerolineae bacterium]